MNKLFQLSTKGLDDLFSTQEQRDEEKLAKIREIPIDQIDPFPGHPFKVQDDEDMLQLAQSIRDHGVVTPATVTRKPDGRYTLISGHRRKRASELAGKTTLRCEVVELSETEATILMVESNYHRSKILPSEKAFSYKMRLDAMKKQGQRTDLTSTPVGQKLSVETIAESANESRTQIQRYIRLTHLIEPLLNQVDEGKLKLRPAVELSYLDDQSQTVVFETLLRPASMSQAKALRSGFEDLGRLSAEDVLRLTAADPRSVKSSTDIEPVRQRIPEAIRQHIPASVSPIEEENYICKALEFYQRWLLEQ